MTTKLVTSYYPFHAHAPFWGQENRDRWYKHSLVCICGTGENIVCYTDEGDKGYNQLLEIKEEKKLDNLTIKIFKLEDNPYQERVVSTRMKDPEKWNNPDLRHYYSRSQQIYWMKYSFLEMELEEDQYLYWIDSGLSHHGLFPHFASKYDIEPSFKSFYAGEDYMKHEYKLYYYDKAFTPDTFRRITEYSEDRIIHLCRPTSDDNPVEFKTKMGFLDVDYNQRYAIAGIFGGNSTLMVDYIKVSKELITQVLSLGDYLCTEQDIMTHVQSTHSEWFKLWTFDTFYHEGWAPPIWVEGSTSFSHFFLKPLK